LLTIERKRAAFTWPKCDSRGEDLKEYVRRFNHEAALVPDLQDGVAYTTLINRLLPGKFKFSLVESKVTTIVDALRKAQCFIQATEICVTNEPQHQENRKRSGEDRNSQPDKRSKRNDEIGGRFHTSSCNKNKL